ncbi:MAG: Ldh family oxidoreductase [Ilumatobacteraceae bacterium]
MLEPARRILTAAFARLLRLPEAERIVDALIEAEMCEVRSHGLLRVAWYLEAFQRGSFNTRADITVDRRGPAVTLIDGDGAIGYLPTWMAVEHAAAEARAHGVAIAGSRRIGEFGRAAYYAEALAADGLIGIVCQNTPPLIGVPGASRATHGNNPLAYAAPWDDAPLYDASFSPRSSGELKRRALLGLPIPQEWGYVDGGGAPLTDPDEAFASVMPAVGGAKGFGISVLVDILAGVLPGAVSGPEVRFGVPEVGSFVLAIDPDLFGAHRSAGPKIAKGASAVRAAGGRWPGDRSRAARERNVARGSVDLPPAVFAEARQAIQRVAADLDLRAAT